MDEQEKQEQEERVKELYDRIHDLIKERGIKWADLALLCEMNPRTLSSMKSQNINPSWTTVRKFAEALDVSMDELTYQHKSPELYELYWAVPREIKDLELQGITCKQYITLAYVTANGNMQTYRHRIDICREEIHERLNALRQGIHYEPKTKIVLTVAEEERDYSGDESEGN